MTNNTKAAVIKILRKKPDEFRWKSWEHKEIDVGRDDLIKAIEEGSDIGVKFLAMVESYEGDVEMAIRNDKPNLLGKRVRCSVCNTETLITKAGDGKVECCGKQMIDVGPRLLPSSD